MEQPASVQPLSAAMTEPSASAATAAVDAPDGGAAVEAPVEAEGVEAAVVLATVGSPDVDRVFVQSGAAIQAPTALAASEGLEAQPCGSVQIMERASALEMPPFDPAAWLGAFELAICSRSFGPTLRFSGRSAPPQSANVCCPSTRRCKLGLSAVPFSDWSLAAWISNGQITICTSIGCQLFPSRGAPTAPTLTMKSGRNVPRMSPVRGCTWINKSRLCRSCWPTLHSQTA